MNRLGIQSLNAGAPDLRLTGDQTQRGTYTQRRRAQMAGGGITNVRPRQGYFLGGIGDFFGGIKDKIVDDLIPNEIKDSPVGAALVGGALLNQFGLPMGIGSLEKGAGQNWLGELLGNVPGVQGGTVDTVIGQGGTGQSIMDIFKPTVTKGPMGDEMWRTPGIAGSTTGQVIGDIIQQNVPPGARNPLLNTARTVYETATNPVQKAMEFLGLNQGTGDIRPDASGRYPINWRGPLTIGTGIGLADYLTRSDDKMPPQLSVNIPQSGQEAFDDPNLRFKPKEQYVDTMAMAAEGGRIGYEEGKSVIDTESAEYKSWKNLYTSGNTDMAKEYHPNHEIYRKHLEGQAQGGRIGYFTGGPLVKKGITEALKKFKRPIFSYDDEAKMIMDLTETKKYTQDELMALEGDQLFEIYVREGFTPPKAIPQADETINLKNITPKIKKAQGGRIGAQEGGLMDLGGMEKDYREEGGFVPIGGQEKADDVPARLSKNEFVFTADAVRSAGGGDIDRGAEIMENLMENLEAGGKVSEESQGLEGAQEMFANTQRLQNRII